MKNLIKITLLLFILNLVLNKGNGNIPIINVHMEEPDRDPIEIKRYEEERRVERQRLRDLERKEEEDKRAFQQIISLQNNQLAKLTDIASSTSTLLNRMLVDKNPHFSHHRFLQKPKKTIIDKK